MPEITTEKLFDTATVRIRDVCCRGSCRHRSAEECSSTTHLVFPYRGLYVRHVGGDEVVAEANQVLFFNADEPYRVSHPVAGGDSNFSLDLDDEVLMEVAPRAMLREGGRPAFRRQRQRIDARVQAAVAMLRHRLRTRSLEPLEAEGQAIDLVRRSLDPDAIPPSDAGARHRRLADRAKVVIASDLTRRWTLAQVAGEVGGSPVHLTRVFQQVEGMPLYRYQVQLRLARALDLIGDYADLTALGLDLGFSSHSHFTAAFREVYGHTPSEFRRASLERARIR